MKNYVCSSHTLKPNKVKCDHLTVLRAMKQFINNGVRKNNNTTGMSIELQNVNIIKE